MPKPVLSDSLFNASDVAEAIVNNVDLSIIDNNLGVSDISSEFTLQSGWTVSREHFIYFNGFVFWSGYYNHAGGTASNHEVFVTIDNSNYYPNSDYSLPTIGYEGDTGSNVRVKTTGDIIISNPYNVSDANYYVVVNGFWHTSIG